MRPATVPKPTNYIDTTAKGVGRVFTTQITVLCFMQSPLPAFPFHLYTLPEHVVRPLSRLWTGIQHHGHKVSGNNTFGNLFTLNGILPQRD